jgi:hypothetical protein
LLGNSKTEAQTMRYIKPQILTNPALAHIQSQGPGKPDMSQPDTALPSQTNAAYEADE